MDEDVRFSLGVDTLGKCMKAKDLDTDIQQKRPPAKTQQKTKKGENDQSKMLLVNTCQISDLLIHIQPLHMGTGCDSRPVFERNYSWFELKALLLYQN